jgi:hypothetical protein
VTLRGPVEDAVEVLGIVLALDLVGSHAAFVAFGQSRGLEQKLADRQVWSVVDAPHHMQARQVDIRQRALHRLLQRKPPFAYQLQDHRGGVGLGNACDWKPDVRDGVSRVASEIDPAISRLDPEKEAERPALGQCSFEEVLKGSVYVCHLIPPSDGVP